jgi:protein-S-isoprenylcysteine O-methyltransferase Ste14
MAEKPDTHMNATLSSQGGVVPVDGANAGAPRPAISWHLALDWIERIAVLSWYAYFVWRLLPGGGESLLNANLLLIASETLVIVLLLIRRPAASISLRATDWFLATLATVLPLSVVPAAHPGQHVFPLICAIVMICGLLVQIRAKISLGRSVGMVPANRGIKRGGIYQLVRHPMYAGYFISHIGFLILNPTLWNASVYTLALVVQIFRILAEERFLAQNAEYREYMQSVRYRLIPGIF